MEDPRSATRSHQGSANPGTPSPPPPPQSSPSVNGSSGGGGDQHSPMLVDWLGERDRSNLSINEVLVSEIQTNSTK